ncbi:amino acid-binding protein [Mesorhizobium sp. Root554]|uniref:branched-chain amino acid ABC transporter substrate-binding protein n=1 Tax=unclassified Mesorhizobium TaxID=325217 RepID=UPI0006F6F2A9|nr:MULTISPECIES: branched-chain amino acid ABC transporter substrate-binding protein [unclassified Mesorhizobium]KQZ13142.1 amino acid-binding protein [Mesorhizobium sp. Root1471]KQZ35657.1 amino acid-binding protein [Mesorhizobium sp. Root554]
MRPRTILSAALTWLALAGQAQALTVGVAAPLSGSSALLGTQVKDGAALSAKSAGVEIRTVDDSCTAAGGEKAARDLIGAKVDIVIGFLCTDAIEAALPLFKDARIPVITVGVRADSLTDRRAKTGWPVFRLGPRGDDERTAAASILTRQWRERLFAIVDDGTIYGREMAESFRAAAEQAALKPVFVDTFRPGMDNQVGLVGRLKKAGATHVFVGGDRDDLAIMSRDAETLEAGMTFAGGETLRAPEGEVPLATGTLMVAEPEWADSADKTALDAFSAAQIIPEGYALPAYAAVEIARQANEAAKASGRPLAEELALQAFRTAIGPVKFDEKGDLAKSPYRLFRFDGTRFAPAEDE